MSMNNAPDCYLFNYIYALYQISGPDVTVTTLIIAKRSDEYFLMTPLMVVTISGRLVLPMARHRFRAGLYHTICLPRRFATTKFALLIFE